MPEINVIDTEITWYCLMLMLILRAAAAGRIKKELMIKMPTHCIDIVTITAVTIQNSVSTWRTGIPLLRASVGLTLSRRNLLNMAVQRTTMAAKANMSRQISLGVMLNRSPMRKRENLAKPPPRESITMPSATIVADTAPITVSVEAVV